MGVSSCSTGSTEPLDSDGLVAHNDQVQEKRYTHGFSTNKVTQCILHSQHNTVISSRHCNLYNTCSTQHLTTQVQRRMVEIFSHHRAEVTSLRRDLAMSRLALTQVNTCPPCRPPPALPYFLLPALP